MAKKRVTIEISEEAANCLAFWAGSEFYGSTLSDVIVDQMREWMCREHRRYKAKDLAGMFDQLTDADKR